MLIDAREKLDISWENPVTTPPLAQHVMQLNTTTSAISAEQFSKHCPTLGIVWQDGAIKKAYDRRREFQIVSYHRRRPGLIGFDAGHSIVLICVCLYFCRATLSATF